MIREGDERGWLSALQRGQVDRAGEVAGFPHRICSKEAHGLLEQHLGRAGRE